MNTLIGLSQKSVTYLEIGIENARTFINVEAARKVGVDPFPLISRSGLPANTKIAIMESDQYFETNNLEFNFAFIDGLHTWEQTYKDIINSLNHGTKDCVLLIDDVVPCDKYASLRDQIACQVSKQEKNIYNNYWMGDVYHVVKVLAKFHPELSFYTINNPSEHIQGLILRRQDTGKIKMYDIGKLSKEVAADDFDKIFGNGIPGYFNSRTFPEILELVEKHFDKK